MAKRPRLAAVLLSFTALACGGEPLPPGGGVDLVEPIPRHDFTLTATDSRAWHFRESTAGRLTFLFFGYASCPDICPVQMAGLASAIRDLAPEDQGRLVVVFVTTDPARDSATALRAWLDHFSRDFVGLTGTEAQVDSVQRLFGLAPAVREAPGPGGGYLMGHAAQVIAFGADDTARTAYPFGQRQNDWAVEIRRLLNVAPPVAAAVALAPARDAYREGFALAPAGGQASAAYPVIRSTVALVDTLVGLSSPDADSVHVHQTARENDLLVMRRVDALAIPPGTPLRMAPGGLHLMLEGLTRPLRPGDTITLRLQFRLQGPRTLRLPLLDYEDVALR